MPLTVLIGGEACSSEIEITPAVVHCTTSTLLGFAPGYPVVPMVVINAAGTASTEAINLTYPVTFAVSWVSADAGTALPGVLAPAPTVQVAAARGCCRASCLAAWLPNPPPLSSRITLVAAQGGRAPRRRHHGDIGRWPGGKHNFKGATTT